jgi:histidinol-phosphate/aromatic aminotransferase/cobyric acid decarboxylase-like protein
MTTIHGGRGWHLARELGLPPGDVLDLSASLNPLAPDPLPVVAGHLEALRTYPDPIRAEMELAAAIGVEPERIVLTNGGAEAIALVAGEFPAGSVDEPEFSLYRRHLLSVGEGNPKWRSNPNNPTGLLAGADEQAAVWDEAFWPLATGTWTRGDADSGSITVGSLTKLLACPGLRIGYVVCPEGDTAERLRRRRPQWSVNGLVCAALPELLLAVDLPEWATGVKELRAEMAGVLTRAGYRPRPSDANWLLVDSTDLEARLASAAICIRDCTSFGLPGTVRIAVTGPDGIERVERAL